MIAATRQLVVGRGGFSAGPFDLDLQPGSVTAVIGPNGVGKSTLLQTLAGLLAPLAGSVSDAEDAAFLPPPGVVAPPFSAAYVVVLGRAARRGLSPVFGPADWAAAHEALARVGMSGLAARRFDRLSSGQQARVMLARVIAQDARLCLLDEPTAMLDPCGAAEVVTVLRLLADDGRAIVIATHDLDLAKTADRVVLIGDMVEIGAPAETLTSDRLSALYATPMTDCQMCGHVSTVAISASPPTSAST